MHWHGFVSVEPHILRKRNSSAMRTAHTVVAENMGRDGEKCCKRLIAFGAKRLAILRAAIAHKILIVFPSCQKCNSRKGDKLPNQFDRLFPADNLARIRTYLETYKKERI